jgi:hypothetical protein
MLEHFDIVQLRTILSELVHIIEDEKDYMLNTYEYFNYLRTKNIPV